MRPLSELLTDMAARAKSVEDGATAARQETHEQVAARIERAKADATRRREEFKGRRDQIGQDIAGHWMDLRTSLDRQVAEARRAAQERRDKFDAKSAERHAEHAERRAYEAIDYATFAIDAADEAVLEAIDARVQADATAGALAR